MGRVLGTDRDKWWINGFFEFLHKRSAFGGYYTWLQHSYEITIFNFGIVSLPSYTFFPPFLEGILGALGIPSSELGTIFTEWERRTGL